MLKKKITPPAPFHEGRLAQLTDQYLAQCHEGRRLGPSGRMVLDKLLGEFEHSMQISRRLREHEQKNSPRSLGVA